MRRKPRPDRAPAALAGSPKTPERSWLRAAFSRFRCCVADARVDATTGGVKAPGAAPKGRRTALSQPGGEVELWGDAELSDALGDAFDVVATETAELADVHGFHSYPARMHPETAQRLIARLSAAGHEDECDAIFVTVVCSVAASPRLAAIRLNSINAARLSG